MEILNIVHILLPRKNHDGKGTCNNRIYQNFKFTNKLVWLVIMLSLDVHEIKIFMKFLVQSFEINMFCSNPFHNEMGQVKIVDKILPKFHMKFIYSCWSNYVQMIILICIITWWEACKMRRNHFLAFCNHLCCMIVEFKNIFTRKIVVENMLKVYCIIMC